MAVYGGPEIATSGLVLYLDAGNSKSYSGTGTTWTDLSGNSNNGTLTNGPSYNSVRNGAIVLDGTNDYIVKDSLASFNVYCISIWVRPAYLINSTSAYSALIQLRYQAAAGNYAWAITLGPSTILVTNEYLTIANVQNNGRIALTDGGSLLANTWYNLVFNYESTEYKFYINGINKATTIGSYGGVALLTNPNKLYIGVLDGDGNNTSAFFNGTIGQVSLYNRALSASEILNNYNALKGRYASYLTDPDAITYVAAVEAADGQELERSVALAYQDFIVGCKADNIWSAIKASCILMGARTLSGASVPLVGTAPTLNSIVSADYNRETGIKLDGSTKTINTNVAPSAYSQDDSHYSVFLTEVNTANPANIFSAYGPSNNGSTIFDGGALQVGINSTTQYDGSVEQANKLLGASRSNSSTFSFRVNGSTLSKSGTSASPTTYNYIVGAQLASNTVWKSNARYSFYSVGNSLDLSKLDARVSALYTAIGAAIP